MLIICQIQVKMSPCKFLDDCQILVSESCQYLLISIWLHEELRMFTPLHLSIIIKVLLMHQNYNLIHFQPVEDKKMLLQFHLQDKP